MHIKYLVCLGAILLVGCVPTLVRQDRITTRAVVASGGLKENLNTIGTEADAIAVAAKANATVQSHVVSLRNANGAAKAKLPDIDAAVALNPVLQKQVAKLGAQISAEHKDFWSFRQRLDFHLVLLSVAGLSVAFLVLDFLAGVGNPVGLIAKGLFHTLATICTAGLNWVVPWVGKFNNWLGTKIKG
jgi:hypothetical protein